MRPQPRILIVATTVALAAWSAPALAQDAPAGWTPAWSDEFNGPALDAVRWENLNRKDSFNDEKQYYHPNQVAVANGQLNITATNVPRDGKAYQSGLVRTRAEQTYGRWEIRASLPPGQGMWPAIWLLPRNVDWPMGGEIDIMENRGSQPGVVSSAYHFGSSVANHQYIFDEFSYTANGAPVSFHNQMHTYGVEWDPSRIRYLVDGVPHYTFYRGTHPTGAPISASPMSLILNLAVGGMFGGDPNASTQFPQKMSVDHVRVFDRDDTTRALNNSSFEGKSGSLFQEWTEYGNNSGGNVLPDSVAANARTGNTAVQMYGQFNNAANNSGLYQEVPTTAGEVWQVGAFTKNRNGDKLAGANTARIKIEFINANGGVIESQLVSVADVNSPTEYREAVLRRTAPAGAVFARAVLEVRQTNNSGGAVNFDDASLRRVTGASILGDINLDGVRNAADLDAINHSLAANNTAFNFNGDAAVNAADVDRLLESAFLTRRGDANLDRAVNFADLVLLAQNYNATATGRWATGDFNGDSNVDFADLVMIAQNYNSGTAVGAAVGNASSASFASDWALAQSIVPEPAFLGIALVAGMAQGTRRQR